MPSIRRSKKHLKSILISDIKYDSTCISLNLPLSLACDRCKPKLDILSHKRKRNVEKKKQIKVIEGNACNIGFPNGQMGCIY